MPRRSEPIDLPMQLPAPERMAFDGTAVAGDHDRWIVLLGEGSDCSETLGFLRRLWPDVERDAAFARSGQRRETSPRSAHVDRAALRTAAQGDS